MAMRPDGTGRAGPAADITGRNPAGPLLLGIALLWSPALAAEGPAACRGIEAPAERLACYDRTVDAAQSGTDDEARRAPAAAPEATADPGATAVTEQPASPEPASPDPTESTASDAADPVTRIAEIRQTSVGRHRYVLANGQVWEQAELRTASFLEPGDDVVVQETLFGGHRLLPSNGRGSSVKVRRLE